MQEEKVLTDQALCFSH